MMLFRGAKGAEVREAQQVLIERGLLEPCTEIEQGRMGDFTVAAIKTLQAQAGLRPDGIIGPKTWDAIRGILPISDLAMPKPDFASAAAFGRIVLEIAWGELGVIEIPPRSNRGPRIDAYVIGRAGNGSYLLGQAYCGRFARWCVDGAAERLCIRSPVDDWGDLASAGKWLDAAATRGKLIDEPRPGRIGIISVSSRGHGHVVITAGVEIGAQRIWTVEGNSGDKIASRWRPVDEFAGFAEVTP